MFGFCSPQVAQRSPGSSALTKGFTTRIRDGSRIFTDIVSNTLKRASRQLSLNKPEIPAELCPRCVEYVLDRSQDPIHDIRSVTSLSLAFDGPCLQQELHVAETLSMMGGLRRLELLDVRITPSFYAILAERAQFQLECFACESPLFESLLCFLSTQQHLLKFAYLTRSLETEPTTRVCGQEFLHTTQTLSTTAPLLLHPQLDAASLRHLEYMGFGQSLRGEIRAIEKICRLAPQLRSLRFVWGAGRTETFLDVTKFFCIATNTSSIKHIYLSDISRNVRFSLGLLNIYYSRVKLGFRYSSNLLLRVSGTGPGRSCKLLYGCQIHHTRPTSTSLNHPYHLRCSPHLVQSNYRT
jgi:hypothetical protein